MLKLKFCLQSLQIIWAHVSSWFDALFIDSDIILNVSIERFELFEVVKKICETCKANVSMIVDFFSISHIDLIISIERNKQNSEDFWTEISWNSDSNDRNDDFDEIEKHWVDLFFFDFDKVFDV